ncbi:MAG: flagellar filament capping protein FliD [Pseudomonadota bacterium]
MFDSLSGLIGGQTGVNSAQLVRDLVQVTREPREAQILQRQELNSARISAMASASSSLSTFAEALDTLLDGRRFSGDLISSNATIATVGFIEGQTPQGLPVTVEVDQLASEQRTVSRVFADTDAAVGEGTLTLGTSGGSFDVVIDSSNNSLAGLRDAINDANSGVSATILTDVNGARLVLAGAEGADESFTITTPPTPLLGTPSTLNDFAYPPGADGGMTAVSTAQNSRIFVDGVELNLSSNSVDNAITGVQLNLLAAAPGEPITISGDRPASGVRDLVVEFVEAYNDLREGLNDATRPGLDGASGGPLAGNSAIRDMVRRLGAMSSTLLASEGQYRTLADIGVRTNNDGTLSIDDARLDAVLEDDLDAISAMLDPINPNENNPGLAGVMNDVRDSLQGEDGPLTLAQERFNAISEDLREMLTELDDDIDRYRAQLERTFANMDRQLAVLRSTQSYLDQQISIWNDSEN